MPNALSGSWSGESGVAMATKPDADEDHIDLKVIIGGSVHWVRLNIGDGGTEDHDDVRWQLRCDKCDALNDMSGDQMSGKAPVTCACGATVIKDFAAAIEAAGGKA